MLQLPEDWFSEEPGAVSDAEVRLFACLAVDVISGPRLDAWVQKVLSVSATDHGNILGEALGCRAADTLNTAAATLCRMPGAGQIATVPTKNALSNYLDRIRRQDGSKAKKAARGMTPLLGLPRPSGKGAHGTRCAAAVPRVAALLNDASERARLESATAEYA